MQGELFFLAGEASQVVPGSLVMSSTGGLIG
uniref:Uncharacterized protein n=1 Tax=Erwinia amylovora ATCC BAA-2158 TaxID=889211 RepID=E5B4L7_ERWAM|nr:hypothetical protein predicted by Glimmer/Critica [Erwinia amylovora ATCC BAA-2158]